MSWAGVLIFAFILKCFEFDRILISGLNEVLGTSYTTNVYWLIAFVIAIITFIGEFFSKNK